MFDYITYDVESKHKQKVAKELCESLAGFIKEELTDKEKKQNALDRLEEVHAWINKGIKNDQLKREGKV